MTEARTLNLKMKKYQLYISLGLVFLALVAVRMFGLASQPFLFDEMFSLYISKHPEWRALFFDNHPPLYHIFLKYYLQLVGPDEFWSRLPSVVFVSLADIYFFSWVLKRFHASVAVFFAILIVCCPTVWSISQLTRPYGLFYLLSVLQITAFTDSDGRLWKKNFMICSVLMLLTHYLSLVILGFEFIWTFKKRQGWKPLLGLVTLSILLATVGISLKSLQWTKAWYDPTLVQFTFVSFFYQMLFQSWPLLIFWVGLVAVGAKMKFWRSQPQPAMTFLFFGIFSLGAFQILSLIFEANTFVSRFTVFLACPVLLWVAIMVSSVSFAGRYGKYVAIVFSAFYLTQFILWYPHRFQPERVDLRKVVAFIVQEGRGLTLTTRSDGLKVPYFENAHLELEKVPDVYALEEKIYSELSNHETKKVYVLETLPGLLPYWSKMMTSLRLNGFALRLTEFPSERGDHAFLLSIERKENQ
jgi:hypothetical protein